MTDRDQTKVNAKEPSGPDNNKNPVFRRPNQNQLYRPTVVQLKCRGNLQLSSPTNNLPICKGIANRLETIREYPPMKPQAALHAFTQQTSFYHPDADDSYQGGFGSQLGRDNPNRDHNRKKRKTKEMVYLPHVVDTKWFEMKQTLQEQSSIDISKLSATESKMNMYGTSNTYLLVLRPYHSNLNGNVNENSTQTEPASAPPQQGKRVHPDLNSTDAHLPRKSIVYAINPVNEFGVAKREVFSQESELSCESTTVKIGFVEIHMASLKEKRDHDETSKASSSRSRMNNKISDNDNDEDMMTEPKPTSLSLPNIPTMQQMEDFLTRYNKVSERIQHQMYQNANFIKKELENDFLNRTYSASQKNLSRMKKTLADAYKFLSDFRKD